MKNISFYIVVTAGFVAAMAGRESPVNKGNLFGYAVTTDNTYVISINTVNDFPGALDTFASTRQDSALTVLPLRISDFPATPPIEH